MPRKAGWPGLPRPKGQDKILRARVRVTRKTGIGSTRLWQAELSLEVQWTRSRANLAPPAALSAASFTDKSQRYKKDNDFEHICSVTDATFYFEGIELQAPLSSPAVAFLNALARTAGTACRLHGDYWSDVAVRH